MGQACQGPASLSPSVPPAALPSPTASGSVPGRCGGAGGGEVQGRLMEVFLPVPLSLAPSCLLFLPSQWPHPWKPMHTHARPPPLSAATGEGCGCHCSDATNPFPGCRACRGGGARPSPPRLIRPPAAAGCWAPYRQVCVTGAWLMGCDSGDPRSLSTALPPMLLPSSAMASQLCGSFAPLQLGSLQQHQCRQAGSC